MGNISADHLLLLEGAAAGYPLPSQHPANDLIEGDRFERALAEAQAPHSSSETES